MTRTVFSATSEQNLPGLESDYIELIRWDGDSLKFNDESNIESADVTRVMQIDGLYDDPPIRQDRPERPDSYGTHPGLAFYGEKPISLTGYVSAGNFPMLRKLQRIIKRHLSFRSVGHTSEEFWTLRMVPYTIGDIDVRNGSFEDTLSTSGWITSLSTATITLFSRINGSWTGTDGAYYLQVTATASGIKRAVAASELIPVIAGEVYSASALADVISQPVGATTGLEFAWYTADGFTSAGSNTVGTSAAGGPWSPPVSGTAPSTAAFLRILLVHTSGSGGGTLDSEWDKVRLKGPIRYEMLKLQPVSIQMPEKQNDLRIRREFLITMRAADPRIYKDESAITSLYGYAQTRTATHNVNAYADPEIGIGNTTLSSLQIDADALGTAKYVLVHVSPYQNWPSVAASSISETGVMFQWISSSSYLHAVFTGENKIKLYKKVGPLIADTTLLDEWDLPYEARNKHVYVRAYLSSNSVVCVQAYTSRPFTIANKANEPNILLDETYTLAGGDLTTFGGSVAGMNRGYYNKNHRPSSDPNYTYFDWVDAEVNDITESPLSLHFEIGGDIPSPVSCKIYGPVVDPTVRITQIGGVSADEFGEEISFLLNTTLIAGEYVEWDPWHSVWTHSNDEQVLAAPGNRYNDLAPGVYTAVMRGNGTDTTNTRLSIFARDAMT